MPMRTAEILDAIGGLISKLKLYATKLPAVVPLSSVPTGVKPQPEAIEDYEGLVTRIRKQSVGTPYRNLNDLMIESLEAFESGKLLRSVQSLLAALDQLERMQRDKEIDVGRADAKCIEDYRAALQKILPGNKPELDGAGRGM